MWFLSTAWSLLQTVGRVIIAMIRWHERGHLLVSIGSLVLTPIIQSLAANAWASLPVAAEMV